MTVLILKNQLKLNLAIAFAFSISVNLLFLVTPIYMLQIYDRVLTSGSQHTLYSLTIIACFLLVIFAFAEGGRKRAVAKAGKSFNAIWSQRFAQDALSAQGSGVNKKVSSGDISKISSFLQSGNVLPLIDLPFAPLFFLTLFLLHPSIGWLGIVGVIVLITFALLGERITSSRISEDQEIDLESQRELATTIDRSSAVIAHGMRGRVLKKWLSKKRDCETRKVKTLSITGFISGGSKSLRQILQTLVLGLGAFMVLQQQMSPGAMIAGSIIIGRGLAPIDQIIGNWRSISLTHEAWRNIKSISETYDGISSESDESISSPEPKTGVKISRLAITAPGTDSVLISPFSFHFQPGQAYALIGSSGSGKTTFLKTLIGVLPTRTGEVILGERNLHQWPETDRGQYIGYLPQSIELIQGSVADNIDRFTDADDTTLHECCEKIGALSVVTNLPKAFDTQLNPDAMTLSAGQQQIIGLARAWFGTPPFLVLDEPTSNLDPELSNKVLAAISAARDAGAVVIVATHDPRLILQVDTVLTLSGCELSACSKTDYIHAVKSKSAQRMRPQPHNIKGAV